MRSRGWGVAPKGQNSPSPGQRPGIVKWLFVVALFILGSCSTDVDIYADYKDTAIVYGLIDAKADTNYVKITRAFCGTNDDPVNAIEAALVYDSSNYPGKLDVFIEELKSSGQAYQPTGRRFYLDTITIHNKEEGVFYAPHQRVYYTTERFNTNHAGNRYRYQLNIIKPDGDVVTAETSVVDGDINISTKIVNFQSTPSHLTSSLVFSSTEEAVLYEFGMQFNYREVHPGQPMERKSVTWGFGPKTLSQYESVVGADNLYRFYYSVNTLFNFLERTIGNDTVWDENHPNVTRYIDDFYVIISAAGEEFNNYYQYTQTMLNGLGFSTDYSTINGGYGLFSSRIFVKKTVNLSSAAKLDLFRKPWGFREQ